MKLVDKETSQIVKSLREMTADELKAVSGGTSGAGAAKGGTITTPAARRAR